MDGFEIDPGVVIKKLDIKDGDTIITEIDIKEFSVNEAYDIFKSVANCFPDNKVVAAFKGIDIKVEKDENRI
jgi:hypothetical protein